MDRYMIQVYEPSAANNILIYLSYQINIYA